MQIFGASGKQIYMKYFLSLLFTGFLMGSVNAQINKALTSDRKSPFNNSNNASIASTGQSGTGANIDVVYHKVYWRINPDSAVKAIGGYVQTNFKTIQAGVSSISIDLNAVLTVDSIRFMGAKILSGNITRTGNVLNIALGTSLENNHLDSIWIYYHGTPPAVSGSAEGYQKASDPTSGQNYIYTLSESYEDRDWWPCKADMQDKIDSMDIIVNVPWSGPDTFWVASNGKLIDSTITGNSRTFTYKSHYPIASYLVCVCVARYNRYYRTVNIGGVNVPVYYYLFRGKSASTYNSILAVMDNVNTMVTNLSNHFGDYPFKRDKHGFYEGLGGAGGMEHQTFSAIESNSLADYITLCHELTHQWFGDKASFATWADLWLAEGFARYGEVLTGEWMPSTGISPVSERASAKSSARSITTTPTRITSFANSNQVWSGNNSTAVYERGCMVVSMLRTLSGDNNFYQACKNYLDSAHGAGYKSANSDSLKNNFNRVLNYDLTPFFNDWVVGVGHPSTVVDWSVSGNNLLSLSIASQTRSAGATAAYFHNVIAIRVQGALVSQDTLIVFYDIDGNNLAKAGNGIGTAIPGNLLTYSLSFAPTTVSFDPYNMTMSAGSVLKINPLDLRFVSFNVLKNNNANEAYVTITDNDRNAAFVLEKSSDGVHFMEQGTMQQVSGNPSLSKYYFKDTNPFAGCTDYRVKSVNTDGTTVYSAIVQICSTKAPVHFKLVQNPCTGRLFIQANHVEAGRNYTFKIFDLSGKLMIAENKILQEGIFELDIRGLAKGEYLLKPELSGTDIPLIRFLVN